MYGSIAWLDTSVVFFVEGGIQVFHQPVFPSPTTVHVPPCPLSSVDNLPLGLANLVII